MSTVGIIANPASGKDIRRIVAFGSVFDNQEKVRIVRRILLGLEAADVDRVCYMPDYYGIVEKAVGGLSLSMAVERLDFPAKADQRDSTQAARLLSEKKAGAVVTLGGDGTNRVVAKAIGEVPILPLSTGTNNVFPVMMEATVAGLAAGLVATEKVRPAAGVKRSTRLAVIIDGEVADIALVDAVVCDDLFVGSRAIWKVDKIRQVFLNRAAPETIGFSSIGGMIRRIAAADPAGLCLELGGGESAKTVTAAVAPGIIQPVPVKRETLLTPDEPVAVSAVPCVMALDGEREVEVPRGCRAMVCLEANGPSVVDVPMTMQAALENGLFVDEFGGRK
jgi:predicted polyphosphate/ATP-dependent NAD kinase